MSRRRPDADPDTSSILAIRREALRYFVIAVVASVLGVGGITAYALVLRADLSKMTGSQEQVVPESDPDTLRVAIARTAGGPRAWRGYAKAIAHLSQELGVPVSVRYVLDSDELTTLLAEGSVDAAFTSNNSYLNLVEDGTAIPLVSPVILGSGSDSAILVVAGESVIRTFADLEDASVAVVDAPSLAGQGYLYVLAEQQGIDPATFFSIRIGPSQERNLEDVAAGRVDATVVNRSQLAALPAEQYRVITESGAFSLPPFVVSARMPVNQRQRLRGSLLDFGLTPNREQGEVLTGFAEFTGQGGNLLSQLRSALRSHTVTSAAGGER